MQPLEHLQRLPLTPHVYMACMSRQYNEVLSRLRALRMEVQQRKGHGDLLLQQAFGDRAKPGFVLDPKAVAHLIDGVNFQLKLHDDFGKRQHFGWGGSKSESTQWRIVSCELNGTRVTKMG